MRKNSLTLSTWNTVELGYFRHITSSAYQQCMLKNLKRIRFPECISKAKFLISNYWRPYRIIRKWEKESVLLIHPIAYDRSGQNKSVRDEELISRKAEHLSIHLSSTDDLTIQSGQIISAKDDLFVRKMYVSAGSIGYAIDFSTAVGERTSQASTKLLNFFKHRPPTAACLIERAANTLNNFQQLPRKGGSQATTSYSSTVL